MELFDSSKRKKINPLFCAVDVARALCSSNPAKAVIDHCKGVTVLETPTNIKYITEPEVYRLIFKSNVPNAEKFNSWLADLCRVLELTV